MDSHRLGGTFCPEATGNSSIRRVLVSLLVALVLGFSIFDDVIPPAPRNGALNARNSRTVAISESGILPYAFCGIYDPNGVTGVLRSKFEHQGKQYEIWVTAGSAWRRKSHVLVEFLVYFKEAGKRCTLDAGGHCEMSPLVYPNVDCVVSGRRGPGEFVVPGLEFLKSIREPIHTMSLLCPTLLNADALPVAGVDVTIHIGDAPALPVRLCRHHVPQVFDIALCSEPLFGYSEKNDFWQGSPRYTSHSLLDAFLVYHVKVLGLHVTIQDRHFDLANAMPLHLSKQVRYRGGWDLHFGDEVPAYAWEILAEATCLWERRLDSLFVAPVSVDQFILPRIPGELIPDLMRRIDLNQTSGFEAPTVQAFASSATKSVPTVLQRWNLLGQDLEFNDQRCIPFANPRHVTHQGVHWNWGRTADFKSNRDVNYVYDVLQMHVVHIMALARPQMNQGVGRQDEWYSHLASVLAQELEQQFFKS